MSQLQQTNFDSDTNGDVTLTGYTVPSGSNRILVLACSHKKAGSSQPMTSVTFGGKTCANFNRVSFAASTNVAYEEFWFLKETDIATLPENPVFASDMTTGSGFVSGTIFVLGDRDQNEANWTWASDGDTTVNPLSTTLTTAAGWEVVAGISCSAGGASFTQDAPLVEVTGSDRSFNSASQRTAGYYYTATGTSVAIGGDINASSSSSSQVIGAVGIPTYSDPGATISSGTPSGTIGTQRRATLGATSTQSTGTFYGVISATEADITGITAAQVYAGQYAGGGAATFSGNAAVTDSTPSVEITGLNPATTYYYAVMHRVGTENSNVISTGSFTTAVATSTTTLTLRDGAGALLNAQTLNFWTRTGLNTVAVDGGTSGLSVTCDASGVFTFTGLSVDAGAGFLTVQNPSDNTYSANYPVTFVAGV